MADPFVAEVRIFAFNFAPKGWAFCDGQLMPVSQNTALFALVGTFYGGDGKSTFALPNMQDNACMHPGQGQGLSLHDLGEQGGSETVTLLESEMPVHNHVINVTGENGTQGSLTTGVIMGKSVGGTMYQNNNSANIQPLNFQALSVAGGNLPHNNMMPYLTVNFCIALQGVFPPRG
jgi:microcystin-dependent protein